MSGRSMKMNLFLSLLVALLTILATPAFAHEEHRQDKAPANEMTADKAVAMHSPGAENLVSENLQPGSLQSDAQFDAVDFLGRLHPAAAHFPIALLLTAAFAELLLVIRPGFALATTVRFLVFVGAAGALGTAFLGWFAGGFRLTDRDPTLGLHRWNGTAIAAVALLAAVVAARTHARRAGLRVLLGILSLAIVLQGFLGGELTFGPNHLGV